MRGGFSSSIKLCFRKQFGVDVEREVFALKLTRYCIIPIAVANTPVPVPELIAITAASVRSAVPQRLGQCGDGEASSRLLKRARTARKVYRSPSEVIEAQHLFERPHHAVRF